MSDGGSNAGVPRRDDLVEKFGEEALREMPGAEDLGDCPHCDCETSVFGPLRICREYCPDCSLVRWGNAGQVWLSGELGPFPSREEEEEEDEDRTTVDNSEPSALGEFA